MKRCPTCRRDFYDDTLRFCLDDGSALLDGPRVSEAVTTVLNSSERRELTDSQEKTAVMKQQRTVPSGVPRVRPLLVILALAVAFAGTFAGYKYWFASVRETEAPVAGDEKTAPVLYWEMTAEAKDRFIRDRVRHVQSLIGDEASDVDDKAIAAVREQIEDYVEDKDSLSQKPFEEGLRSKYGRATQFAPIVARAYEGQKVPAALGLYQAMVESEYHDCPERQAEMTPDSPVGLFQFSRRTAANYGMKPADYCDVMKQSDAAARYMSDLISDFGTERASWTLALVSFNQGPEAVREALRELRSKGITERSFWAIYEHQDELAHPLNEEASQYVPRYFAAAIIGESPEAFDLRTQPLSSVR